MDDQSFAQFYPQSAAFNPQTFHSIDPAAQPQAPHTIALDAADNQKQQSLDFFNYSQSGLDVVAPHPDQFDLELDTYAADFDAELALSICRGLQTTRNLGHLITQIFMIQRGCKMT